MADRSPEQLQEAHAATMTAQHVLCARPRLGFIRATCDCTHLLEEGVEVQSSSETYLQPCHWERAEGQLGFEPPVYLNLCHTFYSQKVSRWGGDLLGNSHSDMSGKDVSHGGTGVKQRL